MFFGILWAASADGYGTTVRAVVMDSRLCQCGWKRSRQVAAQREYCRYTLAPPHASYCARKFACERFPVGFGFRPTHFQNRGFEAELVSRAYRVRHSQLIPGHSHKDMECWRTRDGDHSAVTARATSERNRIRVSTAPPYSSVRRFVRDCKN
jgi:hypothetical protein